MCYIDQDILAKTYDVATKLRAYWDWTELIPTIRSEQDRHEAQHAAPVVPVRTTRTSIELSHRRIQAKR